MEGISIEPGQEDASKGRLEWLRGAIWLHPLEVEDVGMFGERLGDELEKVYNRDRGKDG